MQKKQKREEKKNKQTKKVTPKKWPLGGLQNGQEVVPPFFSKKTGFSKFSKTPIFIAFPKKMGGHHFFSKRLCYKEDTFRRAKKR